MRSYITLSMNSPRFTATISTFLTRSQRCSHLGNYLSATRRPGTYSNAPPVAIRKLSIPSACNLNNRILPQVKTWNYQTD